MSKKYVYLEEDCDLPYFLSLISDFNIIEHESSNKPSIIRKYQKYDAQVYGDAYVCHNAKVYGN